MLKKLGDEIKFSINLITPKNVFFYKGDLRHQIHNTVCSRLKSHHQITMMTNILLL